MTKDDNIKDRKQFSRKVSELQEFIETYGDEIKVLSDEEVRVLNLVSNGKPNDQIAEELDIPIAEVEDYKKNITQKLSIPSEDGLLEYAVVSSLLRIWLDSISLVEDKNRDINFDQVDTD